MKIPGTPGRKFGNPMSPTFNEAEILEKRELATDKEQARDLVSRALGEPLMTVTDTSRRKSRLESAWPSLRFAA